MTTVTCRLSQHLSPFIRCRPALDTANQTVHRVSSAAAPSPTRAPRLAPGSLVDVLETCVTLRLDDVRDREKAGVADVGEAIPGEGGIRHSESANETWYRLRSCHREAALMGVADRHFAHCIPQYTSSSSTRTERVHDAFMVQNGRTLNSRTVVSTLHSRQTCSFEYLLSAASLSNMPVPSMGLCGSLRTRAAARASSSRFQRSLAAWILFIFSTVLFIEPTWCFRPFSLLSVGAEAEKGFSSNSQNECSSMHHIVSTDVSLRWVPTAGMHSVQIG